MKRLLFILGFVLTITLQIQAKDILTVFRVTGEVKCCPIRSEQWGLLARHDTVKLSDRIIIPEELLMAFSVSAVSAPPEV